MIDVHLIGYTADLEHLVLDLSGEANGRYRLVVDADLLATLAEMHERSAETGRDWPGDELVDDDEAVWDEEEWDEETEDWDEETEDWDDEHVEVVEAPKDHEDDEEPAATEPVAAPRPPDPAARPAVRPQDTTPPPTPEGRPAPPPQPEPAEPERREPKLSPAEIQGMLRAGRSAQSVAKAADTDVAWIERWLAPIQEERARILREAHAGKLERPRLGTSRAPLGDAVERSLSERKVDPEDITWETSRRADGRWKVSVKYRHRNRSRTASWAFDPREGTLEPSSDLAREIGFRAPRKAKPKAKPKPKSKSGSRTKTKTKSKTKPKAESGSGTETETEPETEPQSVDAQGG